MKTFKIEIQELLSKTIDIQAKSLDEAILKVKEGYQNEEFVLDYSNHILTEIREYIG